MAAMIPLVSAGISGASSIASMFGGSSSEKVNLPPAWQMPDMTSAANNAYTSIQGLAPYTQAAAGTLPQAQATAGNLYNNPYGPGFQQGAGYASNLGMGGALQNFGLGQSLSNVGMNLMPYAQQIFNTGFDPQNALYQRTAQQLQDQTRVGQSARGIAMSPYGAGLENQALSNFNIDWQNNLLQRQATAAGAGGGLANTGAGISNMGAGLINAAPQSFYNAAGLPYNTYAGIGQGQFGALQGLQGLIGGGANIGNMPVQDWLNYVGAGNQANANNNQLAALQLQQAKQGFGEQQQLGSNLGSSLAGIGKAWGPASNAFSNYMIPGTWGAA